jgi:hypothetical protein
MALDDPLVSAEAAVTEPADAALAYGVKAVEQGMEATDVAADPVKSSPAEIKKLVGELVTGSKHELYQMRPRFEILIDRRVHPSTGGAISNQEFVNDYLSHREELEHWITAAGKELVFSEEQVKHWSGALYQTSLRRGVVARKLVTHFEGMIGDARKSVKVLEASFRTQKEAIDRVRKAIAEVKGAQKAIDIFIEIYDVIEAFEATAKNLAAGTTSTLPAQIAFIVAKGKLLKQLVGYLADSSIQFAELAESMKQEGYPTARQMENKLGEILNGIRDKVLLITIFERDKAQAERLWSEL